MQSWLPAFAVAVNAAMARVLDDGRFGGRKVFVSAVWDALPDASRAGQSLGRFKSQLVAAQQARLLSLARADLVAAMSPAKVAASEIVHDVATYHFVIDPTARDAWE